MEDPKERSTAARELLRLYEGSKADTGAPKDSPGTAALFDRIVVPLVQRCVAGDLDDSVRPAVIRFLSESRDKRAEPCFKATLARYEPDRTDPDIAVVSRAVRDLKLSSVSAELFDAFTKVHASRASAQRIYRDVHDAVVTIADPAWEPKLLELLEHPIPSADDKAQADESYFQITAAEVLGTIRSTRAVRPLLKVLLSPTKGPVQGDAILALVRIGKPTMGPTQGLLEGTDAELVAYAKEHAKEAAEEGEGPARGTNGALTRARVAARVLGALGRKEGATPLLAAFARAKDPVERATIARELPKLPRTAATLKAFQDAFVAMPPSFQVDGVVFAREMFLEDSAQFLDPSLVPWIHKTVLRMRGSDNDLDPIRNMAIITVLKLATHEQLGDIDGLAKVRAGGQPLGKSYENEIREAKELLTRCGGKVDCYAATLTDPNAVRTGSFLGVKAAFAIGTTGHGAARDLLLRALPEISDAGVRYACLQVIDSLSPEGDAHAEEFLRTLIDRAIQSKNVIQRSQVPMIRQTLLRLHARSDT